MMPSFGEYESEIGVNLLESGCFEIEYECCLYFFDLFEETDIAKSGTGSYYFFFFFCMSF